MSNVDAIDANPAEEKIIFEVRPSYKNYLGWIIFSALLIFVGIGLLLLPIVLLIVWMIVATRTYKLTSERLILTSGWIAKNVQEIELYRVQDVAVSQGVLQRIFGVGDISVVSIDKSTPKLLIKGIANPEPLKEIFRNKYRTARKTEGVRTFESVS